VTGVDEADIASPYISGHNTIGGRADQFKGVVTIFRA
jgi:hypothetical protein